MSEILKPKPDCGRQISATLLITDCKGLPTLLFRRYPLALLSPSLLWLCLWPRQQALKSMLLLFLFILSCHWCHGGRPVPCSMPSVQGPISDSQEAEGGGEMSSPSSSGQNCHMGTTQPFARGLTSQSFVEAAPSEWVLACPWVQLRTTRLSGAMTQCSLHPP